MTSTWGSTRLLNELSDAVAEMHASPSLEDVLQVLADRARDLVGADLAVVRQAVDGDLSPPATAVSRAAGASDALADELRRGGPGPWREVCQTNRPLRLVADELDGDGRGSPDGADIGPRGIDSLGARLDWLGAPLVGPDGCNIGIVQVVGALDRRFGPEDEALLVQLARTASVAVENARLYQAAVEARARLSRAARIDRLRAAELRAVLGAIGEAILVFDADGRITLSNRAADRLFAPEPIASFEDLQARLADRVVGEGASRLETRLAARPDCWLDVRIYPVAGVRSSGTATGGSAGAGAADGDGGTQGEGRIAIVRDVTAERRDRLEREAFVGILSHELRTPITTVYAGSKVLARDERIRTAIRRELAADISAEAERLFRVVEDLLVMTRSERGGLELDREPVLLQRVITSAIRLEQGHWPQTRFVVHAPADLPAVAGDALHVEQVARNLLSNAGKYGAPGADVEVRLAEEADGVAVRVLDRGPGLADGGEAPFELSSRTPSTAAQAAGAGIGLFVCRRLVTSMNGRIWARPRDGGGAEFGFVLPRFDSD